MSGFQADIGWQFSKTPTTMVEALEMAKKAKEEGNKCFKTDKFGKAVAYYKTGLSKIKSGRNRNLPLETLNDEVISLEVSLNVNTAMCLVKTKEWEDAIMSSTMALRKDPNHPKALLYRARALIASEHRSDGRIRAHNDLIAALRISPKDKAIGSELDELEKSMGSHSNENIGNDSKGPLKIDNENQPKKKMQDEDDNELRENFRLANRPLLHDNRSVAKAPPPIPRKAKMTKEEYKNHMKWEEEMLKRKHESEKAAVLASQKRAEEDAEDEALMSGHSAHPVSGYREREDGSKVPSWSKDKVVIPTMAPQRVEQSGAETVTVDFNRGYIERDMTNWCMNELLGFVCREMAFKLPDCHGTLRTHRVQDLRGDALMVGVKGKFDHTFDFSFSVAWEAKIGAPKLVDVEVKGKQQQMFLGIPTFHGKLRFADVGHLQSPVDYDVELLWGGDGPKESPPDETTRKSILDLLQGPGGVVEVLRRRLEHFWVTYQGVADPQQALEALEPGRTVGEKTASTVRDNLSGGWLWAELKELEEVPSDETKNKELKEKLSQGPDQAKGPDFDPLKAPKMLNYMEQLQKEGYAVLLGGGEDKKPEMGKEKEKTDTESLKDRIADMFPPSSSSSSSNHSAEEAAQPPRVIAKKKGRKKGKKGKKQSNNNRKDTLNYARFEDFGDSDEDELDNLDLSAARAQYEELEKNPLWKTILDMAGGDGERAIELIRDPEALQQAPQIAALFEQEPPIEDGSR